MSIARNNGGAANAEARAEPGPDALDLPAEQRGKQARTTAEQEYLDARADDAEQAVKAVKRTLADLEKSLKDREADAKTARAHARGDKE